MMAFILYATGRQQPHLNIVCVDVRQTFIRTVMFGADAKSNFNLILLCLPVFVCLLTAVGCLSVCPLTL